MAPKLTLVALLLCAAAAVRAQEFQTIDIPLSGARAVEAAARSRPSLTARGGDAGASHATRLQARGLLCAAFARAPRARPSATLTLRRLRRPFLPRALRSTSESALPRVVP
jgi:hypothetical protein